MTGQTAEGQVFNEVDAAGATRSVDLPDVGPLGNRNGVTLAGAGATSAGTGRVYCDCPGRRSPRVVLAGTGVMCPDWSAVPAWLVARSTLRSQVRLVRAIAQRRTNRKGQASSMGWARSSSYRRVPSTERWMGDPASGPDRTLR